MPRQGRNRVATAALLLGALLAPEFVSAECRADTYGAGTRGQFSVQGENDVLLADNPSDEQYTQGLRFAHSWLPDCEPRWIRLPAKWLNKLSLGEKLEDRSRYTRATSFAVGQHLFTPVNIREPYLIPEDRPYAGWLYVASRYDFAEEFKDGAGRFLNPFTKDGYWHQQKQVSYELQVGVVGAKAQGRWTQSTVHDWQKNGKEPMGWHNQLPNEAGIMLRYQWQDRVAHKSGSFDVVPSFNFAVGNVQTFAGVGAVARIGRNITGFPTYGMEPSRTAANFTGDESRRCGFSFITECYLFGGVDGRVYAHNIFLDGSLFQDSHSVDSEPFVYDLTAGFRMRFLWRALTLNYVYVRRSKEFSPVPAGTERADGEHDFGVLALNWNVRF